MISPALFISQQLRIPLATPVITSVCPCCHSITLGTSQRQLGLSAGGHSEYRTSPVDSGQYPQQPVYLQQTQICNTIWYRVLV
jgi:hypothetical protein